MRQLPNRQPAAANLQRPRVEFSADLNLIEAQRSRAIIDVDIDGQKHSYQSVILRVDPAAGSILIDELFPAGFTGLAGQRVTITVRRQDGGRAGFTTHIIERRNVGGVDNYQLMLPGSVGYQQRREVFRLDLPRNAATLSEFQTGDRQFCAAIVRDLSASGIRLELQNSIEIVPGDTLTELEFEFEQQRFQCQAKVRHVYNERSGETVVGVAFQNFPRLQQRMLERIIMQQQRLTVRRTRTENVR